jgi:hypothetical protein
MMPIKAIRDLMKANRYREEGVTTRQGAEVIPPDELDNWDLFWQAIGFVPSTITWQYEKNRQLYDQVQTLETRKSLIMGRLAMAIRNQDANEWREAYDSMLSFNENNPAMAIQPSQVVSSLTTRQRRIAESIRGVNVPKRLRYLHDQMMQNSRDPEEQTGEQ